MAGSALFGGGFYYVTYRNDGVGVLGIVFGMVIVVATLFVGGERKQTGRTIFPGTPILPPGKRSL